MQQGRFASADSPSLRLRWQRRDQLNASITCLCRCPPRRRMSHRREAELAPQELPHAQTVHLQGIRIANSAEKRRSNGLTRWPSVARETAPDTAFRGDRRVFSHAAPVIAFQHFDTNAARQLRSPRDSGRFASEFPADGGRRERTPRQPDASSSCPLPTRAISAASSFL
jgi:hypothetical protein